MIRQWLQKNLPDHQQVHAHLGVSDSPEANKFARWIRAKIADPMLWHLNRRSVAGAVAVGLFIGWLPIPLQMLSAALIAAWLRVHVPISVVLVWISNPITLPVLIYAAWFAGSTILGTPMIESPLSMSMTELLRAAKESWAVIVIGKVFCATLSAVIGYFLTILAWRFIAIKRWRARVARA